MTETRGMLDRETRSVPRSRSDDAQQMWTLIKNIPLNNRPTHQVWSLMVTPHRKLDRSRTGFAIASRVFHLIPPRTRSRRQHERSDQILEKITPPLPPRPVLRSETRAEAQPRGCTEPHHRASPRNASARRRSMEDRRIGTSSISSEITTRTPASARPARLPLLVELIRSTPNGSYAPIFFCC